MACCLVHTVDDRHPYAVAVYPLSEYDIHLVDVYKRQHSLFDSLSSDR